MASMLWHDTGSILRQDSKQYASRQCRAKAIAYRQQQRPNLGRKTKVAKTASKAQQVEVTKQRG